jgi:hypothetical protein
LIAENFGDDVASIVVEVTDAQSSEKTHTNRSRSGKEPKG